MKATTKILIFLSLALAPLLAEAEPFGLVMARSGENYVTRGIIEFEAQVEEVLMWGDEVETGDDGALQITFGSSFLSIGPNTFVSFSKETNSEGEELMLMNLEEGSFRSKILNLGTRQFFEVATENGRLRVHGTDFVSSFSPEAEEPFNVSVLQGRVSLSNPETDSPGDQSSTQFEQDEPVTLNQHEAGGFVQNGESQEVSKFSLNEANQLKEDYPIPGDEVVTIAIDNLGVAHAEINTLTDSIQEGQEQTTSSDPTLDDIKDEILLQTEFELTIKARIDPDA